MTFQSPNTTPPEAVAIEVFDRTDHGERMVTVECSHAAVHLGCSKPYEVSTPQHVRDALSAHCHSAGCTCSASCWKVWHRLPWPEARVVPCSPERN